MYQAISQSNYSNDPTRSVCFEPVLFIIYICIKFKVCNISQNILCIIISNIAFPVDYLMSPFTITYSLFCSGKFNISFHPSIHNCLQLDVRTYFIRA